MRAGRPRSQEPGFLAGLEAHGKAARHLAPSVNRTYTTYMSYGVYAAGVRPHASRLADAGGTPAIPARLTPIFFSAFSASPREHAFSSLFFSAPPRLRVNMPFLPFSSLFFSACEFLTLHASLAAFHLIFAFCTRIIGICGGRMSLSATG